MNIVLNKSNFDEVFKNSCKEIRKANKGKDYSVKIVKDYQIQFTDQGFVRMVITYLDGDCKYQTYTICL